MASTPEMTVCRAMPRSSEGAVPHSARVVMWKMTCAVWAWSRLLVPFLLRDICTPFPPRPQSHSPLMTGTPAPQLSHLSSAHLQLSPWSSQSPTPSVKLTLPLLLHGPCVRSPCALCLGMGTPPSPSTSVNVREAAQIWPQTHLKKGKWV